MSSIIKSFVIAAILAAAATGGARMAADAAPTQPVEPAKALDPHATHALEQMGRFLRNQKNFTVRTTSHTDYVLDSGQKVKLDTHGEVMVERPNKMRANLVSDRKDRQLFFDGAMVTIYDPRHGYFATATEHGSIEQLADTLQSRYGVELPLVDLFRLGADPNVLKNITEAKYVGPAKIDGVATDQFAFRQPGVDWQIWIQQGDKPLPKKLVFTTTDDPARPEHAIDMAWSLGGRHEMSEFAFVPPKGSQKVSMADLQTQQQQARRARQGARQGGTP